MLFEGQAGPQSIGDGAINSARLLKDSSIGAADTHARYQEAAYRQNAFALDSGSITAAAANTSKGALGTISFVNGFYNPISSGKLAVLWACSIATVSGTPAGPFFYNYYVPGVPVTSAATGTIRSTYLSGVGAGASAMTPQVNVVVATTPASTAAAIQIGTIGGPAAVAAGAGMYNVFEEVAGRLIIPPGCVFGIAATGAGTTHVLQSTLYWEEISV